MRRRVTWWTPLIVLLVVTYWGTIALALGVALVYGGSVGCPCPAGEGWQYDPGAWQWRALMWLAVFCVLSALIVFMRRGRLWRLVCFGIQVGLLALLVPRYGFAHDAVEPKYTVWAMNADGGGQRRLTTSVTMDEGPIWSPDGKKIAFVREFTGPREFGSSIYVLDADGSRLRRLTSSATSDEDPVWSPDGTSIVFERDVGESVISVMNADGSGQRALKSRNIPADPAWSPDGTEIVFVQSYPQEAIVVVNADGSGQRRLATNSDAEYSAPVWSPDGTQIAFASDDDDREIFVLTADGSGLRRLALGTAPTWSPDGTKIAFARVARGSREIGGRVVREIYVVNADGSRARRLGATIDDAAVWSPDGKKIAFASNRDGNDEIHVVKVNGSGQRNVTRSPAYDAAPSWSPDGRRIAFASGRYRFRIPSSWIVLVLIGELAALLAIAISKPRSSVPPEEA